MEAALPHRFIEREISLGHPVGPVRGAERIAVVDERSDRNPRGQFGNSPDVIAVKVGDQQEIETLEARVPQGRQNPVRIAAVACIPGINQQ